MGANFNEVEKAMAEYLGVQYDVGLSCGTAALHLATKLAGEKLYGQARPNQGTFQGHRVMTPHNRNKAPEFLVNTGGLDFNTVARL